MDKKDRFLRTLMKGLAQPKEPSAFLAANFGQSSVLPRFNSKSPANYFGHVAMVKETAYIFKGPGVLSLNQDLILEAKPKSSVLH